MIKNILLSLLLSGGIMLLFYMADNAPKENGGNWIFFSFFSILLAALYFIKNYFNAFLTVFGITFLLANMGATYLLSYESIKSFFLSWYIVSDLTGLLCLIGIAFLRLQTPLAKH
jgi:hypothetical protein